MTPRVKEVLVQRFDHDEFTLAVLTYRYWSEQFESVRQFKDVLIGCITVWMQDEEAGMAAWEEADYDFNVADLGRHIEEVNGYLRSLGAEILEIDEFCSQRACEHWAFDDVLVEAQELEDDDG